MDREYVRFVGTTHEMAIAQCISSAEPSALFLVGQKFFCWYLQAYDSLSDSYDRE